MNQDEHIKFDPHNVDHGTPYYKMGWSAYKGHLRGIIRGLVVGCAVGAGIGAGMFALGTAGVFALGAVTFPALVAGMSLFSGMLASGLMGRIGNASGNVAAQLAEIELRERYPELPEVSPDSPEPGFGHHYEVPADRDKGKFFHPRVGLTGALLGTGLGGLASASGLITAGLHSLELFAVAGAAPVAAPLLIGAVVGSSFGVNRSHFKSIFNFTDRLMQGKLSGPSEAEIAKDRARYRTMGEDGPPAIITSLQRQEEFYRLENGYFKKAFEAAFAGNGRGLVGGAVAGSLMGVLIGGAILGALSLAAVPVAAIAAPIMVVSVAFSMHKSIDFFTEAFFEAAGHGHVHELHHERMRAMRHGVNLGFEEAESNIVKRRQADPELTPPEAQDKATFKPRVAIIMGVLGAIAGVGLAPLATGVGTLLGMGTHGVTAAAGASMFGLTGASFGLGPKITEGLNGFADKIYHGTFAPGDAHPDIKVEGKIPLMSPRSELAEHFGKHLQKNMPQIEYNNDVHNEVAQDATRQRPMQDILARGARSLTDHAQEAPAVEGVQR